MSVIKLTNENFDAEAIKSDKPVLIDFWAPWCGPCRMMSPVVDELAEEATDIKICKVNTDEESELASKFGIMSIPTFVVIKDGQAVKKVSGARSKAELIALVKE